ncbi:MAG: cyclophilin-like fold protein [Candidatus Limimorpha sp.]
MQKIQIINNVRLAFTVVLLLFALSACSKDEMPTETPGEDNNEATVMGNKMKITIGNATFTATLEDNDTAKELVEMLPMILQMCELNGNEKYHYLTSQLPTNASNHGTIHAGDIMLYGPSCLVLFYKTFSTSYSYTRIGRIDNVANLAEAVGNGDVSINFEI